MTTIGNYKLVRKIGTGGFSKVMLAEDIRTGEKVALKIMKNSGSKQGLYRKSLFENEVAVLKELELSTILKLKGSSPHELLIDPNGKEVDINYIALEYAQYGELFDYVAKGEKFSEKTTRFFFNQIIKTLEYMASKGYSHRDIKPENLLFGSDFTLKFADFGFATKSERCTQRRGTFGYMAPEVLANKPYNPRKADIFSAAVILFIMTTKHCPFIKAEHGDKYYNLVMKGQLDKFWELHQNSNDGTEEFSEDFKDLINGMLQANPKARLSLDAIKNHPWMKGPMAKAEDIKFEFRLRKKILEGNIETTDPKESSQSSG
mmetsp:Transcript_17138/g.16812  ORF Transcript_17138/g.16812 Transcript_17138/m.16812 type:complete len:318 (+) Transcript_17138:3-956(+)